MPDALPDIRVAVDFGTTSTGAMWSQPTINQDAQVQPIDDWPGDDTGLEIKVPSVLAKRADANGVLKWGFACEKDMDETSKWRYLKVFLDPEHHEASIRHGVSFAPPTSADVHRLVRTYLNHIYLHIKETISGELKMNGKEWNDRSVEFVFSIPTTWSNPRILRNFRNIIHGAGFGVPKRHEATLGVTEAEAAGASYFIRPHSTWGLRNGDTLLSIDAGGGTTDFGVLRVVATKPPALEQIQDVRGIGTGSMLIDMAFRGLVEDRLRRHRDLPSQLPDNLPLVLSQHLAFHKSKCSFGPETIDGPPFEIPLRGTGANFQFREIGIVNGRFQLERRELQHFFDVQFQGISNLLGEISADLAKDGVGPVKHILLSGGLGGSAYVLNRLKDYVENSGSDVFRDTQVHQATEPRLAVLMGLLFEQNNQMLRTRVARASYGVVADAKYDEDRHHGEHVVEGLDGHKQVRDQIVWLVQQGQRFVTGQRFSTAVTRQVKRDGSLKWPEIIVVSGDRCGSLPKSMKKAKHQAGSLLAEQFQVVVDLNDKVNRKELLKKPKLSIVPRPRYLHCEYTLSMVIGASGDVSFEVEYKGHVIAVPPEQVELKIKADWDVQQED